MSAEQMLQANTIPWSPTFTGLIGISGPMVVSALAYRQRGRIYCELCFTATATASGPKYARPSLPVAATFTANGQVTGMASGVTLAGIVDGGAVSYDTVNGGPYIGVLTAASSGVVIINAAYSYADPG